MSKVKIYNKLLKESKMLYKIHISDKKYGIIHAMDGAHGFYRLCAGNATE